MKIKTNNFDIKGSGVYRITNEVTGKVYIGSSVNLLSRYRAHASSLKHNSHYNEHLQRSYNLYGSNNFEFEIIEQTTKNNRLIREQFYLDQIYQLSKEAYYNASHTANGSSHTEEGKLKLSRSIKKMIWEDGHIDRMRRQSEEINLKRRKISNEFILSNIVVKYIASKSIVSTAAEFNMSKSALARIFKRINGEHPVLYCDLLAKIGFDGDSITDLHKAEVQSKLTLFKKV